MTSVVVNHEEIRCQPKTPKKKMKDFCLFLDERYPYRGKCCDAGVNFASVGEDRALCRVCPLAEMEEQPLCPNAEVYTFLEHNASSVTIQVEFFCMEEMNLPAEKRCQNCPDHLHSPSVDQEPGLSIPIRDET